MTRLTSFALIAWLVTVAVAEPVVAKPSAARKVRGAGDAPAFGMFEAVSRARVYARRHRISLAKQYLQSASFDVVARTWSLAWQMPNAKGGRTMFTVGEDDQVTVDHGE